MSKTLKTLRLPLAAGAFVLASLLTACGDATGPQAKARSGYINASSEVQVAPVPPVTLTPTPTPRGTKAPGNQTNSGYNVTA